MGLFRKLGRTPDLEERVLTLEREMKSLQLDWDTTYEKLRVLSMRLAKRERRLADVPDDAPTRPVEPRSTPGAPIITNPLAARLLSPAWREQHLRGVGENGPEQG